MEPPVVQGDSYEPDYTSKCMSCGGTPVVTVMLKGECIYNVGLCGPCTWGEAAMADPEKWNE